MRLSPFICSLLIPAAALMVSGCSKNDSVKNADGSTTSTTTTSTTTTTTATPAADKYNGRHQVMVMPISELSYTPEQQQYCLDLQNRLAEGWRPLKSSRRYSVAVEFMITRPGYCSNVHHVSATGGQRAIERTVDSVKTLSPLPLPADFKEAPAAFRCDFTYTPEESAAK